MNFYHLGYFQILLESEVSGVPFLIQVGTGRCKYSFNIMGREGIKGN